MCPLRLIALLLVSLGLASYMGPLAMAAGGGANRSGSDDGVAGGSKNAKRAALWLSCLVIFVLHTDLLLSLGYTRCAFQYAANLHKLR
mmetsp:Transcript_94778/g.212259  ORF Transcript_94778/g.212259 Transcript_94778/m.212259 type:complete len:88 (-) Transcript_94778:166-429(-)